MSGGVAIVADVSVLAPPHFRRLSHMRWLAAERPLSPAYTS
jgi:hypothetical protein